MITGTTDTSRIEAPITFRAYLICAFAAFGGIFFGYDTGWMGGVLAMPYFIRLYTGLPYPDPNDKAAVSAFHLPASDQSLTTSILSCGTFFGAIIAGDCADFIGRRMTIITGCGVFTIGCILETASTGLGVMVAGRLIAGLGVGFISAIVILYMSVSQIQSSTMPSPGSLLTDSPGNRPQSCSWRRRLWISILYHHRYPACQLCRVRHSEPGRHWLIQDPHCRSVPVGNYPRNRSFPASRISPLLRQEGQARSSCQIALCGPWTASRFRLYPR